MTDQDLSSSQGLVLSFILRAPPMVEVSIAATGRGKSKNERSKYVTNNKSHQLQVSRMEMRDISKMLPNHTIE